MELVNPLLERPNLQWGHPFQELLQVVHVTLRQSNRELFVREHVVARLVDPVLDDDRNATAEHVEHQAVPPPFDQKRMKRSVGGA